MDLQERIDESRRLFARSLVGRWSTAQGTFDSLMGQHWEIRSDGTGRFTDTGPFGYPRSETRFEWRQSEDFLFELRLTEVTAVHPQDVHELGDEEREWQTIRYDFVATRSDLGVRIGMLDVTQSGEKFAGFLYSLAPLSYEGPERFVDR